MKQMKKLIIISLVMVFTMLSFSVNNNYVFAENETASGSYYLTKSTEEAVNPGEDVTVSVYLDASNLDNVDTLSGVLLYDQGGLSIKKYSIVENSKFYEKEIRPNIELENDIKYKDTNKNIASFAITTKVDKEIGQEEIKIANIVFDTSKCKAGKTYNIDWQVECRSVFGEKTAVSIDSKVFKVSTEGTSITIAGTNEEDDTDEDDEEAKREAEEEAKRKAEEEKKAAEEAKRKAEEEKKAAEEAKRKAEEEKNAAEEAKRKAEEEKNANKGNTVKGNTVKGNTVKGNTAKASNTAKGNTAKTSNTTKGNTAKKQDNTTANTTTVKDKNVDKMPQTGSNLLTYIIILLAVIEVSVFVSYKKMKKYSGI